MANRDARIGRIPLRHLTPSQPEDRWPAKAFAGEVVPFGVTAFREGHGILGVDLLLVDPAGTETRHAMSPGATGSDRWEATVAIEVEGDWHFRVEAYSDDWATWLHNAEIKIAADQDVELVFAMGAELIDGRAGKVFADARTAFRDSSLTGSARLKVATDARLAKAIADSPIGSLHTVSDQRVLHVERERAAVGSWYEFFPRSEGAKRKKDGTATDAQKAKPNDK